MKNKQYIISIMIILLLTVSIFMPWYYTQIDWYFGFDMETQTDTISMYLDHTDFVFRDGDVYEYVTSIHGDGYISYEFCDIFKPILPLCIGAIITSIFIIIFVYKKAEKFIAIFSGITAVISISTITYLAVRIENFFSVDQNTGFITYFISEEEFNTYISYPSLGWIFVTIASILSIVLVYQYIKNKKNDKGKLK